MLSPDSIPFVELLAECEAVGVTDRREQARMLRIEWGTFCKALNRVGLTVE